MYAIADLSDLSDLKSPVNPVGRELEEIEDLRRRTLANRAILYGSPPARYLVEKEIPRPIEIVRRLRRAEPGASVTAGSGRGMESLW